MSNVVLSIRELTLRRDDGTGAAIINDFSMEVEEGEVIIIKGESGSGKTTLLKCIAELNIYQSGEILLYGRPALSYGIPVYRTRVQYIPQRPSLLPGTPIDFLTTVRTFKTRQTPSSPSYKDPGIDPIELASSWGISKTVWQREWAALSGGEGQRIALAIAVGLGGADVILLDEPTSALDEMTMQKVEKSLLQMLPAKRMNSDTGQSQREEIGPKALIWITHEASQAYRVGTRTIDITRV